MPDAAMVTATIEVELAAARGGFRARRPRRGAPLRTDARRAGHRRVVLAGSPGGAGFRTVEGTAHAAPGAGLRGAVPRIAGVRPPYPGEV